MDCLVGLFCPEFTTVEVIAGPLGRKRCHWSVCEPRTIHYLSQNVKGVVGIVYLAVSLVISRGISYTTGILLRMSLSITDIEKIAGLARLSLTEAEKEQYARELSTVLDYFAQLNEVDTSNVPETCQVTGLEDVTRADEVVPSTPEERAGLLAQFPKKVGALLEVQAVFAGRMKTKEAPDSGFEE